MIRFERVEIIYLISTCLPALSTVVAAELLNFSEPGQLALFLDEEEFEVYIDSWLEIQETKYTGSRSAVANHIGCTLKINGNLGQPQPVFLHNNKYLAPTGNTGSIHLNISEEVVVACPGSGRTIQHPNINASVTTAIATCVNNDLVSGEGWLVGTGKFGQLTCSDHPSYEAQFTNARCFNNNRVIRVGFIVNNNFYPLYFSCFDQHRLEVLYSWYEQNNTHAVHQYKVDRPRFIAGSFFPGVNVNGLYTRDRQKETIASLVGQKLAEKYITSSQYLARGHLAAKTDFVYATGQRASFYFINVAPQWQPFNAGNWNMLEQNLRLRISEAGYNTVIYTGTFGVTQLRDQNDSLIDIYLYRDANNNLQLPVPLYYYKVVYDSSRRHGTAFIGINNPYYAEAEARRLMFCTDRCRNNRAFRWLRWHPDRIDLGYSFCCTIDDFRRTIPHLPAFKVDDLLS